MRDDEIKKIAEEVARILKGTGLGASLSTTNLNGGAGKYSMPGDSVSIGTAGKVFQNPLVNKPGGQAPQTPKKCSGTGDCRLEENTCSSTCQSCNPLNKYTASQVKEMGVERVSFCNPDQSSIP